MQGGVIFDQDGSGGYVRFGMVDPLGLDIPEQAMLEQLGHGPFVSDQRDSDADSGRNLVVNNGNRFGHRTPLEPE
ncbi:carbohydrate kinase [Methylocaldum marinum]|uniref:Carbohydrate kinase n=1 Tax=Methylocaldum marinum TaxID=1432792 RepID=A0A250KUN2_9GAMM|nr:carbohydrate kinase [Methylocaldum marinum]